MNLKVNNKYDSYPDKVRPKLLDLRSLILRVANSHPEIDFLAEDLKWGEPSFLTKSSGSTIRIDWKSKLPNSISIYLNCQTKLISIYKELYPNDFEYFGNREIRLSLDKEYTKEKLSKCIELAFKYNLIKGEF